MDALIGWLRALLARTGYGATSALLSLGESRASFAACPTASPTNSGPSGLASRRLGPALRANRIHRHPALTRVVLEPLDFIA
jgi:hypothetical protein